MQAACSGGLGSILSFGGRAGGGVGQGLRSWYWEIWIISALEPYGCMY